MPDVAFEDKDDSLKPEGSETIEQPITKPEEIPDEIELPEEEESDE